MAANSNIPGAKNKSSPKSGNIKFKIVYESNKLSYILLLLSLLVVFFAVDESFDSESLMSSWASEASPPYYKDRNIDPRLDKGT